MKFKKFNKNIFTENNLPMFKKLSLISFFYFFSIKNKNFYQNNNNSFNIFNKLSLNSNNNSLLMLSSTEIIKGEYENKLRIFSPLEKRYIIFGKIKKIEDKMTYIDFFDSLIPFQHMDCGKYDDLKDILEDPKGEFSKLFKEIVDINGDGKISFEEYSIFCFIISSKYNII